MAKRVVTVCHGVTLIRKDAIIRFANSGSEVDLEYFHFWGVIPPTVPGTVYLTTDINEGIYTRNMTFEITDVDPNMARTLSALKSQRLVATYKDESGNQRVCGSPDYPLSLDYYDEGGVYVVSLTGQTTEPDPFVIHND